MLLTQKHVLPLACIFFDWFLRSNIFLVVLYEHSECCFRWRGLMYEVRQTWFVGGLGPPPPHPPPIARRLFIGFQNLHCSKSNFQHSKLKFEWPFRYNKCVSWWNWVFKIKITSSNFSIRKTNKFFSNIIFLLMTSFIKWSLSITISLP